MIALKNIHFGSIDARSEVFSQERENIEIFNTSFVVPPSINMENIISGAKYFIVGPKGSGKTALLMHLKYKIDNISNARTVTTLFKTDLTESERQKLIKLSDIVVDVGVNKIQESYDYKQQWMWYVYEKISMAIEDKFVIKGIENLEFLRKIFGISKAASGSIFSSLKLSKIKAKIKAAISSGVFGAEVSADIDIDEVSGAGDSLVETINIIENKMAGIYFDPSFRICLFFDELELFVDKLDRRERDLRLIRDLVYTVNRANRRIGSNLGGVTVYAALRTEVISELNRLEPETKRSIKDFAASISWNSTSSAEDHPLIGIFHKKINNSEIACGLAPTEDVWGKYFPEKFKNQDFKKFLLDISMLKPRNIVRILNIIKENNPEEISARFVKIDEYMTTFSLEVWEEVEEELMTSRDRVYTQQIKAIFTRIKSNFDIFYLQNRIKNKISSDYLFKTAKTSNFNTQEILETMYRLGAIGNRTSARRGRGGLDRWVFRDYPDPDLDQEFTVHRSLWKTLQIG